MFLSEKVLFLFLASFSFPLEKKSAKNTTSYILQLKKPWSWLDLGWFNILSWGFDLSVHLPAGDFATARCGDWSGCGYGHDGQMSLDSWEFWGDTVISTVFFWAGIATAKVAAIGFLCSPQSWNYFLKAPWGAGYFLKVSYNYYLKGWYIGALLKVVVTWPAKVDFFIRWPWLP